MMFNVCRPFYASSLLGIVRILLEQTRHDEMQILGCSTLVDFINSQVNTAITDEKSNSELQGFLSKLDM